MHEISLDPADVRMLRALQSDGRLTNNDLAARVGLSASQCSRRRAALEEAGVIAGYRAVLSQQALGLDVLVFVHLSLETHSPDNARHFLALAENMDEVQEAYTLTGDSDYILKLSVPSLKALTYILAEVFVPHPAVARVRSSIVLKRLKEANRLPLDHVRTTARETK